LAFVALEFALDDGLGRDPGVVDTREPEGVLAA